MVPVVEHKATFCRICEPLCGMIATVEDGRLVALRPDREHPLSAGFACPKGIAFSDVINDEDRVTTPLRRGPDGFEPVDWDTALDDIAARLAAIHRRDGSGAIGWYFGNPAAFSYSHLLAVFPFVKGLGRRTHLFTSSSQDTSNRLLASQLLYGAPLSVPIPDLPRTDLLIMMGSNPVVSHGSFLTTPRIKDRMSDIVKRGGRVVILDPRRTETAAAFEWQPIAPDGDAYLLLSLLQVLFAENLVDEQKVGTQARGLDWLREQCAGFTPEATAARTGIPPDTVRALARELAGTERAAVYGRFGTCVGRHPTLTAYLIDVVNLVTGHLDVPGGSVFATMGAPGQRASMALMGALLRRSYRRRRSRVGGFPQVVGAEPAAIMAKEIATGGRDQIRALFVSAGNPVLSVPNGDELESALEGLELMVGLDLYVNETTAHCDYVLPVTTMYERDDFALVFQNFQTTPFRQATEAVVAPYGQCRSEWDIIAGLTGRLWRRTPMLAVLAGLRGLLGRRWNPRPLVDAMIRTGTGGDRFGLRRGGLTFNRLTREFPHGVVVDEYVRTPMLGSLVAYRGARIRLAHVGIGAQIAAAAAHRDDPDFPMRLIGMRQPRSENSWMHNSQVLMGPALRRGGTPQVAVMHAGDAERAGIADGDLIRITSAAGAIEIPVSITEDIVGGVVAVPHGFGHGGTGGWRLANRVGGVNVNRLNSTDIADIEPLAGMSRLSGVPVRVEPA
ncbi:formate dehydrogenase [Mycolicibacterium insubricum]|uniref:Formate dehydrogenase n=1 Tax=Mycolicibacterium insubricum TaxID=444597 RepID=A0A1X0DFL7_9MYCO|nr:molybdopterin-dependent oxidoreductase [Mycolicibacterium insubricum]MCV7083326.1 molybdopterin-dependent oxidoreductase [Mycolicibacterium insubricum]ORA71194.1 formate dehydrogenase [Mycolicibacterium insubricum]BBZ68776.1 formate dehydrogenase [Mycolicibacterium insubricum]